MSACFIARRLVAVATLLAFSTGCVMVRAGELPRVAPWPPAAAPSKKTVSLTVASGTNVINGAPAEVPPAIAAKRRELMQAEYVGSGLFSTVVAEGQPADVRAEVLISEDGHASQALAFICGLTMFLVPARAEGRMTMQTTFKNSDGDVLAKLEKSETTTMWMQLFLIFAMPFNRPITVGNEAFEDLSRATLSEGHAQGIF